MAISKSDFQEARRRLLLKGQWTDEDIRKNTVTYGDEWPSVKMWWGLAYTLAAFDELEAHHTCECCCDFCADMELYRGSIKLFADVFGCGLGVASHEAFAKLMAEKLGEEPVGKVD